METATTCAHTGTLRLINIVARTPDLPEQKEKYAMCFTQPYRNFGVKFQVIFKSGLKLGKIS